MTDDENWIELSAAIRNVVALLTNKKATSEAGNASEVAVAVAGVLTEGEETAPVDLGKTGRCPRNQHRCKLATLEFMTASDGRSQA